MPTPRTKKPACRTGDTFGHWTVIGEPEHHRQANGLPIWKARCRCSCGNEVMVRTVHLLRGETRRCATCGVRAGGPKDTIYPMPVRDIAALLKRTPMRIYAWKHRYGMGFIHREIAAAKALAAGRQEQTA
jgi:hypothetical protein